MIDYVAADNACVELYEGDNLIAACETAKSIAYYIAECGINDNIYCSSSMDFADEYGFENADDAHKLLDAGINMYRHAA